MTVRSPAPVRFRLARPARSGVRSAHVVLGIGWTGLALVMLALPVALLLGGTGPHSTFVLDVMAVVGEGMIPFFAVGTVLTGVVAGLGTPWGVFRYRWVVAKTVLALAVIASSVAVSTRLLATAQAAGGTDVLWWLAGVSVAHQVALIASTVLSVEKPGGRLTGRSGVPAGSGARPGRPR
ncbi:hypothetical protein [Pseudonocardia endophytica]|uniref:DUF2269 family protein n=1 Tax=Pseudonocardia endophytica TaxID=401976 RepID=A0A4R1HGI3_PSEEN|nr:hypothetical protein [Pseudonocardia endophytica]TCK19863.1 hypothetical protein EV378_3806 [Pseudonocardia endophytica]